MNKKIYHIARIILGFIIVASGAGVLFNLMPIPEFATESANEFMQSFTDTGYFMQFLSVVKIACGLALISNKFVPLALIVFIPVSINMFFFHIFLDITTVAGALIIIVLNIYLLVSHLKDYRQVLVVK